MTETMVVPTDIAPNMELMGGRILIGNTRRLRDHERLEMRRLGLEARRSQPENSGEYPGTPDFGANPDRRIAGFTAVRRRSRSCPDLVLAVAAVDLALHHLTSTSNGRWEGLSVAPPNRDACSAIEHLRKALGHDPRAAEAGGCCSQ